MNSVFLLIAALVAFVFGYRFYSKFLAAHIFRLDINYSIPDARQAAGASPCHRHLLLGQHVAIIATGATITGSAVALIWGWIPAFLWVVVGTTVAAGTFGLGSLWLSARHPGQDLAALIQTYFPGRLWDITLAVTLVLLTILNAALVVLTARLFVAQPSAALPFWIQIPVALGLGVFLSRRQPAAMVPASGVSLILILGAVWLLAENPIGFSGALNFDLAGNTLLSGDAAVAWIAALLAYGYYAARQPVWKMIRPHGYLTALQIGLLLLAFFAAVLVLHPPLVAPGFNRAPGLLTVLPWLFVTLSGGAIAGVYLLFASAITGPYLSRETDARLIGYGGALGEGLIALSAIIVFSAGFGSVDAWKEFYVSWEGVQDPGLLLKLYVNGFAYFTSSIGLDRNLATTFATVTLAGLLVTTLAAGMLLQQQLMREAGKRSGLTFLERGKNPLRLGTGLIAILALVDSPRDTMAAWPLFGASNLILVCLGLLLIAAALIRHKRSATLVLGLLLFLLPVTLWALGAQVRLWWYQSGWGLVGVGLLLFVSGVWIFFETIRIIRKPTTRDGGA